MVATSHTIPSPTRKPVAQMPGAPVLGNLLQMRKDPLAMLLEAAKLGDVVRLQLATRRAYLLCNPDAIKHVFVDNHKNYGKQTRGYNMMRLALGNGLVTSEGDFWKRQRRIAQPAFHHSRIMGFGKVMTDCTERMLERWSAKPGDSVFDLDSEMMSLTLEIVGRCLMSTDLSDASDVFGPALGDTLELAMNRITNPLVPPMWVPTPGNRRLKSALEDMDRLVIGLIEERRSGEEKPDLLDMLLRAKDEETGEGMSNKQLRDEVLTLISAGHETTSNSLTWTFYLLSKNPGVREKLIAEVQEVLQGRAPTMADLQKLPYTEAVIKESMRVLPAVWMVGRSVTEPDEILGVPVEPGAMIFISPWVMHRDPKYFQNPEGFEPERFLNGSLDALPKNVYIPFAGGPRVCIGNSFAMMEATLLLAMIMQKFRLDLVPGHPVVPQPTITLRPKYGMKMKRRKID